jgi:L-seryl-tRNA(Ser) seleniumtransferase
MDVDALAAYIEAAHAFVRTEDLQQAASAVIARITGAEGGYVTPGAAAAVALATAACLAGLDVDTMDRLPDTAGIPHEVVIQRIHRNPYDHMVRAAGARLVAFGADGAATVEDMEAAISANTVAAFYHAQLEFAGMPFQEYAAVAHRHNIPVIVDAAMSLPPASNLRRFIAEGADAVAFSGGKTIRGPQASGFLAGRRELLLSVALQHQDMDVLPATWSRRSLLQSGLKRPPQHGIGRSMKVGKEEIAALIVALEKYVQRDHGAEQAAWEACAQRLAERIHAICGLPAWVEPTDSPGRPVPLAVLAVDGSCRLTAAEMVRQLQAVDPMILVNDYDLDKGLLKLNPENLQPGDEEVLVEAFRQLVAAPADRSSA